MPLVEANAAQLIFAKLDAAQDYGEAPAEAVVAARARLRVIANAFAKCIPALVAASGSITVNAVVSGASTSPPTVGAVTGSGLGKVVGLVQGVADASTGLAGAIVSVLVAGMETIPGADVDRAISQLCDLADAVAQFASYVMTNGEIRTTDQGVATLAGVNGPTVGTSTGWIA